MMTLYTAIGRLDRIQNRHGNTEPAVTVNGRRHLLTAHELLLYSSLYGEILSFNELKKEFYQKERDAHILGELDFEHYLKRLIMRGLTVSGRDVTGCDALYDLLGRLYVRPARKSFWGSFMAPSHRDLPLMERKVLRLCHSQPHSTAELMQCLENGRLRLKDRRKLADHPYHDGETDCQNTVTASRFADVHVAVLTAVTNLYLKRAVLFESL